MDVNKYYQADKYKKIDLQEREKIYPKRSKAYVKAFHTFLNNSKKQNQPVILDVGCGDGGLGVEIMKHMPSKFYGVDISRKGVHLAQRNGIPSKAANVEKHIPFDGGFFDAVIANEIIEHLYDTDTFIEEIKRILKKRGIFIIGTPNLSSWFNRLIFLLGIYPLYQEVSIKKRNFGMRWLKSFVSNQPVGHVRVYNVHALKDMLEYYGFTVEHVYGNSIEFATSNTLLNLGYGLVDSTFSYFPTTASDIMVVARKI